MKIGLGKLKPKNDIIMNLSWILTFVGIVNVRISTLDISGLAIRCNFGLILFAFVIKWYKNKLNRLQFNIIMFGFALLIIQVYGAFSYFSSYSFSTIILTGLILVYLSYTVYSDYANINVRIFHALYYIIYVVSISDIFFSSGSLLKQYSIGGGGNSMGGIMLFLTCCNIALRLATNDKKLYIIDYLSYIILIPYLMITRARTAIFVSIYILVLFLLLNILKLNKRKAKNLYWVIIVGTIVVMYVYIQFDTFEFYSILNDISVQLFNKNINSSRPRIWRGAFYALRNNWILGLGTGINPINFSSYAGSFHNQFIQLLIQNGLCGLILFYIILYILWRPMANNLNNVTVRFCAAAFIGIILYNCFETTLLQNKMALGIIEWQLISIGVSIADKHNCTDKEK